MNTNWNDRRNQERAEERRIRDTRVMHDWIIRDLKSYIKVLEAQLGVAKEQLALRETKVDL